MLLQLYFEYKMDIKWENGMLLQLYFEYKMGKQHAASIIF
jgi:hypothetical protein